jgi:hypothetical protein
MTTRIDLATLAPESGFTIEGTGADTDLGTAGDVNGDGFDDLIFGSRSANQYSGAVHVVFGAATGRGNVNLNDLGPSGVVFEGVARSEPGFRGGSQTGASVSAAGDVNGDGFGDIVFGAPGQGGYGNYHEGAAYVIFGDESFASVDLSNVSPDDGIVIHGDIVTIDEWSAGEGLGVRVGSAGDVDGDGFDEFLIDQVSVDGSRARGVSLYSGDASGIDGYNFFEERGLRSASAGDINGDGYSDVILERTRFDGPITSVMFGGPAGVSGTKVSVLDIQQVDGLGDLNGDGLDDIAGLYSGTAHIFFGRDSFPGALRMTDINPVTGLTIGGGVLGFSGVGDLNGDGFDELAVTTSDGVKVLFGHAGTFEAVDASDSSQFDLIFEGSIDKAEAAGDVNGDGLDDLLVKGTAGAYVVYGSRAFAAPGGNDTINGTAGADAIDGGGGSDTVYGYAGDDILSGGAGDDTLFGHDGRDTLYGADGADRLYGGLLDDQLYGDAGNDVLNGQAGNDTLGGGDGNDVMRGGDGDDRYRVGSTGDWVIEEPGGGGDTVTATVDYRLTADVENLVLTSAARTGIGNDLANTLFGSGSSNVLKGADGDDILRGKGGRDVLLGGAGADLLDGGIGKDTLTGDAGRDVFVFRDGDLGSTRPLADEITDFRQAVHEKIQLRSVDADATITGDQGFTFIGSEAFTGAAGQLRYDQQAGNTYVEGDVNGDGAADFAIMLLGAVNLVQADFVL